MTDFFVSYNSADRRWAVWVAAILEEAEFTTFVQEWDIPPGSNFVLEMQRATVECDRTIAVLSDDYFASLFTAPEWAVAFREDPTGSGRKLLPVRVRPCEPPGLVGSIVYTDLVGLDKEQAADALLRSVKGERLKPQETPGFPGGPVVIPAADAAPSVVAARQLIDTLRTSYTTFLAQARLRDQLVARMRKRLQIDEELEYEPFFARYYGQMDEEESRLHKTMRDYTGGVMREYNAKALEIAEQHPGLETHVPRIAQLKQHLRLWRAKFDSLFESSPDVCLVYVGVAEKVGFPQGIEGELEAYLESAAG